MHNEWLTSSRAIAIVAGLGCQYRVGRWNMRPERMAQRHSRRMGGEMTDKDELALLALLRTRVKVLETENASLDELLGKQTNAYEDFVWTVLGMFNKKNMEAFKIWVANVNKAIDKLPSADMIREKLKETK